MSTSERAVRQLQAQINASQVIVVGIGVLDTEAHTLRPDWAPDVSDSQKAIALAVIAGFDWSPEAEVTRREALEPDLVAIRNQASAAISDSDDYIAIADGASAAQVRTQVKKLTQRQRAILKTLSRLLVGRI